MPPNGRRKRLLWLLIGLFLAAGAGYGIYWALVGRYGMRLGGSPLLAGGTPDQGPHPAGRRKAYRTGAMP